MSPLWLARMAQQLSMFLLLALLALDEHEGLTQQQEAGQPRRRLPALLSLVLSLLLLLV